MKYCRMKVTEMQLIHVLMLVALFNVGSALDVQDNDFFFDFSEDDNTTQSAPPPSTEVRRRRSTSVSFDSFKSSFASLQEKFSSIPDKYKPKLQFVFQKLNSTVSSMHLSENLPKAKKVVESVAKNWDGLTGDDAATVAKAICDVVGVVGGLVPPPAGTVISVVVGLVSHILGMASPAPKPKSMGEIVQEVVQKELREQHMLELKAKIQGAVEALELNQVFLNGYTGGRLSDRDYHFMVSQFNFLTRLELRSGLAHIIETLSKSKKKNDATDALGLIDSYVTVTSMVEVLMHTMKSILDEDTETQRSAENLGHTIEAARGQTQRHLQFLRNPKVENGALVALYDPAKHPNVEAILDGLEIPSATDFLDKNGCYILKNKNMDRVIAIDGRDKSRLAGRDGTERFKTAAKFGFVKSEKSWYLTTEQGPVCGGAKYFYIKKACPPNTATYRIYAFTDGGYMIVNEHEYKATNPLWMKKDGEIRGFSFSGVQVTIVYLVNAEEITWNNDNPEYVWQLENVPCQE